MSDITDQFSELLPKLDSTELDAIQRVFDRHNSSRQDGEILTAELMGLITCLQEQHAE